jgi:hypothetical protein
MVPISVDYTREDNTGEEMSTSMTVKDSTME